MKTIVAKWYRPGICTALAFSLCLYIGASFGNGTCQNPPWGPSGLSCVSWNVENDTDFVISIKFDAFYKQYHQTGGYEIKKSDSLEERFALAPGGISRNNADAYFVDTPSGYPTLEPNDWAGVVRMSKSSKGYDYYILPRHQCSIASSDLGGKITIKIMKSPLYRKTIYIADIVMPGSANCSGQLVEVSKEQAIASYGEFWKK
ncbi:MAG TPA: hypothetical protein VKR58_13570 [Aquella sp.]|nr:hypothetical protein [Aquella sp.]